MPITLVSGISQETNRRLRVRVTKNLALKCLKPRFSSFTSVQNFQSLSYKFVCIVSSKRNSLVATPLLAVDETERFVLAQRATLYFSFTAIRFTAIRFAPAYLQAKQDISREVRLLILSQLATSIGTNVWQTGCPLQALLTE